MLSALLRPKYKIRAEFSSKIEFEFKYRVTDIKRRQLSVAHPLQFSDQLDGFLAEHPETVNINYDKT